MAGQLCSHVFSFITGRSDMSQLHSPLVLALLLAEKGNFPVLYSTPSSFSCSSDLPTQATSCVSEKEEKMKEWSRELGSPSPRHPKPIPAWITFSIACVFYWKRYMHRMRSGDETKSWGGREGRRKRCVNEREGSIDGAMLSNSLGVCR